MLQAFIRFFESRHFITFLHYLLALITIIAALSSCQPKPEQPTLSDEQAARVMADMHTAEAATVGLVGIQKDSLVKVYYQQVLDMHGLTIEAYQKEMQLLAQDPDHYKAVLEQTRMLLGGKAEGAQGAKEN